MPIADKMYGFVVKKKVLVNNKLKREGCLYHTVFFNLKTKGNNKSKCLLTTKKVKIFPAVKIHNYFSPI